jgi:hypothetical protein
MLALLGHIGRAILERYSHVRLAANPDAVESLSSVGTHQKTTTTKPPQLERRDICSEI